MFPNRPFRCEACPFDGNGSEVEKSSVAIGKDPEISVDAMQCPKCGHRSSGQRDISEQSNRLAQLISEVITKDWGRELKLKRRILLDVLVSEHLDTFLVRPWLEQLLQRLINGEVTHARVAIPEAMDWDGGGSFGNLIADVSAEIHPFDYEDCGEDFVWNLVRANRRLYLCREASPYFYAIEKLDPDKR